LTYMPENSFVFVTNGTFISKKHALFFQLSELSYYENSPSCVKFAR